MRHFTRLLVCRPENKPEKDEEEDNVFFCPDSN